jgi:hypothetical protein
MRIVESCGQLPEVQLHVIKFLNLTVGEMWRWCWCVSAVSATAPTFMVTAS